MAQPPYPPAPAGIYTGERGLPARLWPLRRSPRSFHAESLAKSAPILSTKEIQGRASRMVRNCQRLARRVDEPLDVSHIAAGRLTLEREERPFSWGTWAGAG